MAKRKRIIKKTYNEFLSWLEGVESMQEENWVPNGDQWNKIREMLNHIKPEEVEMVPKARPVQQPVMPATGPVARIIDSNGVPEHSAFQPAPQPRPAPRRLPSGVTQGVPTDKESILNPGESHAENEFL